MLDCAKVPGGQLFRQAPWWKFNVWQVRQTPSWQVRHPVMWVEQLMHTPSRPMNYILVEQLTTQVLLDRYRPRKQAVQLVPMPWQLAQEELQGVILFPSR